MKMGHTSMNVRSFDYRFGNVCNYKCRHCEPNNSSLLELEEKKYNANYKPIKSTTNATVRFENLEKEILTSAYNGTLEELQWAGGESLFSESHWRIMQEIIKNGDPSKIKVSYITNLSIMEYKGIQLLELLDKFKEGIKNQRTIYINRPDQLYDTRVYPRSAYRNAIRTD